MASCGAFVRGRTYNVINVASFLVYSSFPLFHARMPNYSQQVHPQAEDRTPSPEVSLSTRTSPSKLVKVSPP
jgi:hypothetical protein